MRKAVVVGINNYSSAPLRGCINDASKFAEIIETNGDGSPNFDVMLETDVPTKAQLINLLKLLYKGDDCDTALFYFSGHGHLNELGGFIVTPDAIQNDEGVSMDTILKLANASKIKNKIIILDCCHSGAMGSPKFDNSISAQIVPGVTILTASKEDELSFEVNGHGVFTNLLLNALEGGAADLRGHITPGSVYAYVDQALGPFDQRPVFKTNISQFTSLRKIAPQVSLEVLRKLTEYFPSPTHIFQLDPAYEYTNENSVSEKIAVFKHLQKFESVGLVVPVDEEHMFWAAINSKSCRLTALGYHYWRLVKDKRI